MPEKYSNIIFDLDGTLLDSIEGICFSINEAINLLIPGQAVELSELKPVLGLPIDTILRLLKPEIPEKNLELIVKEFRDVYDQRGWQIARLYDSVAGTLEILRASKVGLFLATNKPAYATNRILDYFGLAKLFEGAMTPDQIPGMMFSKKEMIEKLKATYSFTTERTLYVGDTISDAVAAKGNGIAFALAIYGYGNKPDCDDEKIDYEVNCISEIVEINKGEI